jgi:hypothetical protein
MWTRLGHVVQYLSSAKNGTASCLSLGGVTDPSSRRNSQHDPAPMIQWSFDATSSPAEGQQLARHLHITVSQGFGGPRSSSSCICITNHFFSLTDTAASASAILLQQTRPSDSEACKSCVLAHASFQLSSGRCRNGAALGDFRFYHAPKQISAIPCHPPGELFKSAAQHMLKLASSHQSKLHDR